MKFFTIKKLFQYYLPVTFTLFMLVTIERTVVTDGGFDKLFGLPFPYISNNYGFSFHYDIYLLAMLLDLVVYLIITIGFFKIINTMGLQLKTHPALVFLGIAIIFFWLIIFIVQTQGSSFEVKNAIDYRITHKHVILGLRS